MPLHAYTPGLNLSRGIEPVNAVPVDSYSGPYVGGSTTDGVSLANATIPGAARFLSMEVRVLAPDPQNAGQTLAYKYWYRGSTANSGLVEFSSTGGSSSNDFPTGISAAGATFNGLVRAYSGISANGSSTLGTVTATSFSGPLTGAVTGNASTATTLQNTRGFSLSGDVTAPQVSFNGGANVTLTTTIANGAVTNAKLANSTISGVALGGQLQNLSAGHLLSGGPYNGSGAITLNATGASLGANTFTGLQTSATGFSGPLTGAVTGNASTATTLETARGFSLSGDVTAPQVSFNGGGNVTLVTTIANGAVTNAKIASNAAIEDSKLATISTSGKVSNTATTATAANNISTIVLRDGSGNFSAGTITAALTGAVTGNASTATTLETARGFSLSGDVTAPQVSFNGGANVTLTTTIANGSVTNAKIASNAAIEDSKLATISTSGKVSNTATTATNANNPSTIVLRDGSGNFSAGTITAALTGNVTGNASTSDSTSNFGGLSHTSYAKLGSSNTFSGSLNTFNDDVTIGKTLTVSGNFYVAGTVTTVNRTDLQIDDKIIVLGRTLGSDGALQSGAGLYVGPSGSTADSWTWNSTRGWESSSLGVNIPSTRSYSINGTSVLSSTTLGSGVQSSSLTSVGTIGTGIWQGSVIGMLYGGAGGNINALPNNGVIYKTASGLTATAAGAAGQVLVGSAGVPTWTNFTALTGLTAERVVVNNTVTGEGPYYLMFADATSGAVLPRVDSLGITFNATTNILSCVQIEAIVDGGVWS
jgi:hypothetical protein